MKTKHINSAFDVGARSRLTFGENLFDENNTASGALSAEKAPGKANFDFSRRTVPCLSSAC